MILQWYKYRDPDTTELVHYLFDPNIGKDVATVRKAKYKFEVKILDRVPWHRRKLSSAKKDAEFVYLNTKNQLHIFLKGNIFTLTTLSLNKLRLFAGDTKMLIELVTLGPLIAVMILIVLMAYGYID